MKNLTLAVVAVSIAVFTGSSEVMAQKKQHHQGKGQGMQMMQGSCPMQGMRMNEMHSATFSKGRIAFLEAELEITESQKKQFEEYATSVRENLAHMQNMRENMHNMMQSDTPVERLDMHITMMEDRLETLKEIQEPLEALFETLTDAQKEKASQLMLGMACMH